ncbi:MAG: 50S ribosomal protein L28 [Bdellovibrionia bacterium]
MARFCDYCDKGPTTGNLVSHSNIKTRTRWLPNLHRMKAFINGATRTVRVCTRCIRSGAITKPVKRTWKPEATKSA